MFDRKMSQAWRRRRLLALGGVGATLATNALTETPRVAQADGPVIGAPLGYSPYDAQSDGVQGYAVGANNAGTFGRNNDLNGVGVYGAAPNGTGVLGESANGTGVGARSTTGNGVYGTSTSGDGVRGESTSGRGVHGEGAGGSAGVSGVSQSGSAVQGVSQSGTGVLGTSSTNAGVFGMSTAYFGVTGMSTNSNGVQGHALGDGLGVVGYSASNHGLYGRTDGGAGTFAGYFDGSVMVTGNFTVLGSKSAAVPHPDGSLRQLYCLESPESYFEDFGGGQLANGRAQVRLDSDFAAVVHTGSYRVFLTPRGDCRGLYVTDVTASGFEVRELQGGTSAVPFDYRIVAKRKDIAGPRLERRPAPASIEIPGLPRSPTGSGTPSTSPVLRPTPPTATSVPATSTSAPSAATPTPPSATSIPTPMTLPTRTPSPGPSSSPSAT